MKQIMQTTETSVKESQECLGSSSECRGGKFNDALINIGGYLTRCYITANIHFPNSCSDAFSTCFETSTLKITSISKLQCCISLKFDMFNIEININEGNMLKLKEYQIKVAC